MNKKHLSHFFQNENIFEYLSSVESVSGASQFNALITTDSQESKGIEFDVLVNKQTAKGLQYFAYLEGEMTDYNGAKPIKTERDNETKIILVDGGSGTSATNKMSIIGEGDSIVADTNDFGIPVRVLS